MGKNIGSKSFQPLQKSQHKFMIVERRKSLLWTSSEREDTDRDSFVELKRKIRGSGNLRRLECMRERTTEKGAV